MSEAVMGDFANREDAQRALLALRSAGIAPADISVIVEQAPAASQRERERPEVGAGAFTGALTGAILGGLAGWILSLGVFDLYGVGRFATRYAAGSTLAGVALGAALLGLLGATAGLHFGDPEAPSEDEEADVLITVRSRDVPAERIAELMEASNALNVQRTDPLPSTTAEPPATTFAPPDNQPDRTTDASRVYRTQSQERSQ